MNNPEQPKQDPRVTIEALKHQISLMGANDTEFSDIDIIVAALEKGKIDGEEAVRKVREILNSKQDYH